VWANSLESVMEILELMVECDFDSDDDATEFVDFHSTVHLPRMRSSQPSPRFVVIEVEGESSRLVNCILVDSVTMPLPFRVVLMME
jgi:hypothetical protein